MPRRSDRLALPSPSPGTKRELVVHRYGEAGARPKAYLQAALHADEWPGILVLHHLGGLLDTAVAAGRVAGEIVIVPYANPIGLAQQLGGVALGRDDLGGSGNFNRNWPELAAEIDERLGERLGEDPAANVALLREALLAAVEALPRRSEVEALKAALLGLSIDADVVMDLHCDSVALLHVYANQRQEADALELARDLEAPVVLLETDPGGAPFDQANHGPWGQLGTRFGCADRLPLACFSTTVELRGRHDVDDATARRDAGNLLRYLSRRGIVEGALAAAAYEGAEATPLEGCDVIKAPAAGIVLWHAALGSRVEAGAVIGEILDPAAADPGAARTPVTTRASGVFMSHAADALVRPGEGIAKVAGREPLPHRRPGQLLEP